jgi:hypothetical protein
MDISLANWPEEPVIQFASWCLSVTIQEKGMFKKRV